MYPQQGVLYFKEFSAPTAFAALVCSSSACGSMLSVKLIHTHAYASLDDRPNHARHILAQRQAAFSFHFCPLSSTPGAYYLHYRRISVIYTRHISSNLLLCLKFCAFLRLPWMHSSLLLAVHHSALACPVLHQCKRTALLRRRIHLTGETPQVRVPRVLHLVPAGGLV